MRWIGISCWFSLAVGGCGGAVAATADASTADAGADASPTDSDAGASTSATDGGTGADVALEAAGPCKAPRQQCNDVCVDVSSDPSNCGACGAKCSAGWMCTNGMCGSDCGGPGGMLCPGVDGGGPYCTHPATDNQNCGQCGRTCSAGSVCSQGQCACGCQPPSTCCAGAGGALVCVDTLSDDSNCGVCGMACPAGATCVNGVCK